jgi:hypothetical protein
VQNKISKGKITRADRDRDVAFSSGGLDIRVWSGLKHCLGMARITMYGECLLNK